MACHLYGLSSRFKDCHPERSEGSAVLHGVPVGMRGGLLHNLAPISHLSMYASNNEIPVPTGWLANWLAERGCFRGSIGVDQWALGITKAFWRQMFPSCPWCPWWFRISQIAPRALFSNTFLQCISGLYSQTGVLGSRIPLDNLRRMPPLLQTLVRERGALPRWLSPWQS
jgi:hypothetical protein